MTSQLDDTRVDDYDVADGNDVCGGWLNEVSQEANVDEKSKETKTFRPSPSQLTHPKRLPTPRAADKQYEDVGCSTCYGFSQHTEIDYFDSEWRCRPTRGSRPREKRERPPNDIDKGADLRRQKLFG